MTYSFPDAQEIAQAVKEAKPAVATVLGGYHVIGLVDCPPGFDFVIKGKASRRANPSRIFSTGGARTSMKFPG